MGAESDIKERLRSASDEEVMRLFEQMQLVQNERMFNRIKGFFPDEGPLRRELYTKHVEFFRAGSTHRERCFMAGNRSGKTIAGAFEVATHATGDYPHWWEGRVFDPYGEGPLRMWAAGDTNETTRDVIQKELFGNIAYAGNSKTVDGTGMIPRDSIVLDEITWKAGVADLIDTAKVHHKPSGTITTIGLKSYAQGRKAFQGTAQHLIWVDEECPYDVYNEMLIRTMTTNGISMLTFTPLNGLTETVLQFLGEEFRPGG